MSHYKRHRGLFRHSLALILLPVFLMGVAYALLSQNLSIHGAASDVGYIASQSLLATYGKTETFSGGSYTYSITMTVKNNGSASVSNWSLGFAVPTDTTSLSCPASVSCSLSGQTATITDIVPATVLVAGSSKIFTFNFTSATPQYTLQSVTIQGTPVITLQPISGLTVQKVAGTRIKQGKNYTYPYTFTVTNTSGNTVTAWQVVANYSRLPTATTVDTTVGYTTSAAAVTFTSLTSLANGSSITFNASFKTKLATWTVGTMLILGSY